MAQLAKVKRLTFDAGWMRCGWPERVGGLGGSTLLRAYLGEALTARDLVEPGLYSMTEVLAPTMIDYAAPELAAAMVPRLLRGDETWCQGFSEPGTGSNLASLSCRADRAPTTAGGSPARRCGPAWPSTPSAASCSPAPARPSRPTGASPRCSSTWTRPGITVRPIETMHGSAEFCEVFFDDVAVPLRPHARRRGPGLVGGHGPAALRAQHGAVAPGRLPAPAAPAAPRRRPARRARPGPARRGHPAPLRLPGPVAGDPAPAWPRASTSGPETSIDKVLLATAEQAVFDLVADGAGRRGRRWATTR